MLDPRTPRLDGIECLREAIMTVPIPGAPPRLSKDGAAVGLAFLDIALRQNHIRRLTERLTLIEHRTARCTTEVDISLGMLDHAQREAGLFYQHVRSRGAFDPRNDGTESGSATATKNVMWVPISLARRGHAPVDVINGEGNKLPRLTQYETSRLLASAMYRLFRLVLQSHPDVGEPTAKPLHDFLYRLDKPRWLVQAALYTLLTERNKAAARTEAGAHTVDTVAGVDAICRARALEIFSEYESTLREYVSLLDHAVNDYLLVVALDPTQDEHLLAFDSPLHVQARPRRSALQLFRLASGVYWVEYRTQLPANLRAYHLVAETEQSLEIDTMSLTSDADRSIVDGLSADLVTLSRRVRVETDQPTGRRGQKVVELELQSSLRRLSELFRRRRWEASQTGLDLSNGELAAVRALVHVATSGEAKRGKSGQPLNALFQHELVTPENLAAAAQQIKNQELRLDLSVESEPAAQRAHVYWRRDPSRVDRRNNINVTAQMFIRDTSGSNLGSIIAYVLGVAGISYLLGCLRFADPWPFSGSGGMDGSTEADAIIAVLLLAPGFLYTRLSLPDRRSIAGQLRKLPRLVAHITIGAAALLAVTFAATENVGLIRASLAACVAAPLLSALVMLAMSRAVKRDTLPVTSLLPRWAGTAWRRRADNRWWGRFADWWWQRPETMPNATFSLIDVRSAAPEGRSREQLPR